MRARILVRAVCIAVLLFLLAPLLTVYAIDAPLVVTHKPVINGALSTLYGEIEATGGEDADYRGFVWDLNTHANPMNTAPAVSGYSDYWTEAGSFGIGVFSYEIIGLTPETMYMVRACAHNSIGWTYGIEVCFLALPEGSVYIELRPQVVMSTIRALGKPTAIHRGAFNGYSLPVYNNNNEELFYLVDIPERWDGVSNIIVHIDTMLGAAGESGNRYRLELGWQQVTVDEDVVPGTLVTLNFMERVVYTDTQYQSYECFAVIDYDLLPADIIMADDLLALRIRRIDATSDELIGEVVVLHLGVQFARGDFLGDPEGSLTIFAEIFGWIGDVDMVFWSIIFLCVSLTIGGYVLHRGSLAFAGMIAWMVLAVWAYLEAAGVWGIYMGLFWLSIAMIFTSGLEGALLSRGTEQAEDEIDRRNAMEKALDEMDEKNEARRNRRLGGG